MVNLFRIKRWQAARLIALHAAVLILCGCGSGGDAPNGGGGRVPGSITFHADIAPIIYEHCTPCHQEGQPGPFELSGYADVKKRAEQIVKVTQSRFMPPWLPDEGHGEFAESRRLADGQLSLIRQWVEDGAPEGNESDGIAPVSAPGGWQLGQPDLVVEMAEPYMLAADGPDVYRNFVIPLSLPEKRYVRAVEFQPRTRGIHHAFMMLDPSRQCRRLDARDSVPGFEDMALPPDIESPGGYFLSWQPGRRPVGSLPGMAWTLKPEYDLVLQMHMQPSGKIEPVRPAIGIYFTEEPPTNSPIKICLSSHRIDIPPGERNYEVSDRFVMPADAALLSVMPHAHFLARTIEGYAILPGGRREPLIRISDWNFNWQSDYRFVKPLLLPRGTELVMRYTYDNSTNNIRNPSHPPRRVTYGPQTRDEMGELWIQLLPRTPEGKEAWQHAIQERFVRDALEYNAQLIAREPANARARVQLSKVYMALGEMDKARDLMQKAIELDPEDEEAHYNYGVYLMNHKQNRAAAAEFGKTLQLNPRNIHALNNLGLILLYDGQFDNSERVLRDALRINPNDEIVKANLALLARARSAQTQRRSIEKQPD